MRKAITILLALVMVLSLTAGVFAASDEAINAANELNKLGLFNGVGTYTDGTPNYDLDRVPTRNEAITMLVRLLGKEDEAKNGTWNTPFTDVVDWAKPYVGYAYANKLTSGTSDTTFGGDVLVSATQYITFVLRALGYDSSIDFQWDKAWVLSDQLGFTSGQYGADTTFLRGDVGIVSSNALSAKVKGEDKTLLDTLGFGNDNDKTTGVYDYLVDFTKKKGTLKDGVYSFNLYEKRNPLKVNEYTLGNLVFDDNNQELRLEVTQRYTTSTFGMVEYEGKTELTYLWTETTGTLICPRDFKDYSQYSVLFTTYTPAYTEHITEYSETFDRNVCKIIQSGNKYDIDIIESNQNFDSVIAGMNVGARMKDLVTKRVRLSLRNLSVIFLDNKKTIFNDNDFIESEIPDFFTFFYNYKAE